VQDPCNLTAPEICSRSPLFYATVTLFCAATVRQQAPTLQYAKFPSLQKEHILTQSTSDNDSLDMNEALCSILSGEDEWCFDAGGRSIKFNEDGTGEVCRSIPVPLR
jgi:hypothetical protein